MNRKLNIKERLSTIAFMYMTPLIGAILMQWTDVIHPDSGNTAGWMLKAFIGFMLGMAIDGILLVGALTLALVFNKI